MSDPVPQTSIVVPMGDLRCSANPAAELVTFALGSCVGVCIYDPVARVGGMLHAMLPQSRPGDHAPRRYVDVALPMLFREAYALGADKSRLQVKIAGCAAVLQGSNIFRIGARNLEATLALLERNGVPIAAQATGGHASRTLRLAIGTGTVSVEGSDQQTLFL